MCPMCLCVEKKSLLRPCSLLVTKLGNKQIEITRLKYFQT